VSIDVAEFREQTARNMSEKELSQLVADFAESLGWFVYRTWNSRNSPSGFPDIVAVETNTGGRQARIICAELKTERGELTEAQARWLDGLHNTGVEAYLWRSSDWMSGTIEAVLRGRC